MAVMVDLDSVSSPRAAFMFPSILVVFKPSFPVKRAAANVIHWYLVLGDRIYGAGLRGYALREYDYTDLDGERH